MKRVVAAVLLASTAAVGLSVALAQDNRNPDEALGAILQTELDPQTQELADQLVKLSGTGRTFDEVLPMVADQVKNNFIRANPDMQLGIISVVDRVAVSLVSRRPELDNYLASVWASGFTPEEMQELIDFYETDTGQKFAESMPRILAVQAAAAKEWGRSIGEDMKDKVTEELRAAATAEQRALQGDIAGPAAEEPATPQ